MPRSADDRLRELLAALAAEDVEELVAEARAGGRDEAREVLQRLWRDAYLDAARPSEPEPTVAAAQGDAWWVYCVVAATDAARMPPDLRGVEAAGPIEVVARGDLAAIVSRVPLPDYGDERLRQHLEDLAWVERVARAHERVLEVTMAVATIVPLRLCTIYLTRERVESFLDGQARELGGALAGLRGRTEWGVKVFAPAPSAPVEQGEAAGGSDYLQRKRGERAAREEAHRRATQCAQDVHERLEREAVRACVNPPQRPEAHGRDTDMLLNGAYLFEDEHRGVVRSTVDELVEEYGPLGFSIELTGPWPPYNFVAPSASAIR